MEHTITRRAALVSGVAAAAAVSLTTETEPMNAIIPSSLTPSNSGFSAAEHDPLPNLWSEWLALDNESNRLLENSDDWIDSDFALKVDPLLDRANVIVKQMAAMDAKTIDGVAAQARMMHVELERYGSELGLDLAERVRCALDRMVWT